MAKKKTRRDSDWGGRGAYMIPRLLGEHSDWMTMTGSEYRVMFLLIAQYRGNNNGDLAATESMMEARGGMAKNTLRAALEGLQERNLIIKTRNNYRGESGMNPSLYALTWIRIHECPGKHLEIGPTERPLRSLA
ncbi:hypothetical protein G1E_09587 [Pseudomonas sp. TJI-51]|uniref:hypothetical protein n=1 Tax=unclassified Pseudomonas TaxID=196821 RepID=UPI0001FB8F2A|nr:MULTISPECIES: hypothetical protein [unclassified Pseudomonas]EGB99158.1 hypothetical protein G1E_09587 [Pseudomonas sp. TJI-51]